MPDVPAEAITAMVNLKYIFDNYTITAMDPANNVGVTYTPGPHTLTVQQLIDPTTFPTAVSTYDAAVATTVSTYVAQETAALHAVNNIQVV